MLEIPYKIYQEIEHSPCELMPCHLILKSPISPKIMKASRPSYELKLSFSGKSNTFLEGVPDEQMVKSFIRVVATKTISDIPLPSFLC